MTFGLLFSCAGFDRLMFTPKCEASSGPTAAENRRLGLPIVPICGLTLTACQMEPLLSCSVFTYLCQAEKYIKTRACLKHAAIGEQLAEGARVLSSFGTARCSTNWLHQKQLDVFGLSNRFNFVFHRLIPPSSPVLMLTSPLPPLTQVVLSPTALPHDSLRGMLQLIAETDTLGLDPSKV